MAGERAAPAGARGRAADPLFLGSRQDAPRDGDRDVFRRARSRREPDVVEFASALVQRHGRRSRDARYRDRSEHSEHWRLERLAGCRSSDPAAWRSGSSGTIRPTPAAVVLNEALELARALQHDEAVRFVNGVLDAVRKAHEPVRPMSQRMSNEQNRSRSAAPSSRSSKGSGSRRIRIGSIARTTVSALVAAHGATSGETLEAERPRRGRRAASSACAASARRTSWCCRTGVRACRSTCARTRSTREASASSSCSTSATTSASRAASSAPGPTS